MKKAVSLLLQKHIFGSRINMVDINEYPSPVLWKISLFIFKGNKRKLVLAYRLNKIRINITGVVSKIHVSIKFLNFYAFKTFRGEIQNSFIFEVWGTFPCIWYNPSSFSRVTDPGKFVLHTADFHFEIWYPMETVFERWFLRRNILKNCMIWKNVHL